LAHELLRARILRDGELQPNHIEEVANRLDRHFKRKFWLIYSPAVTNSSRVIIRKIDDGKNNVKRKMKIRKDYQVILLLV
jgi:hypothetical protein